MSAHDDGQGGHARTRVWVGRIPAQCDRSFNVQKDPCPHHPRHLLFRTSAELEMLMVYVSERICVNEVSEVDDTRGMERESAKKTQAKRMRAFMAA